MVARRVPGWLGAGCALLFARSAYADPPAPKAASSVTQPEAAPGAPSEAAPAAAAPAAPAAGQATGHLVTVTFRSEIDDSRLRVQGPGIAPSGGDCGSSCTMNVTPGKYTLYLTTGGSVKPLEVYVREGGQVVVSGPNGFHKGLGLALIIGGGTALTAGGLVFYVDQQEKVDDQRHPQSDIRYRSPDWVVPVEIVGAVGGAVTIVGVVLFLTARTTADVVPDHAAAARLTQRATERSRFLFVPTLDKRGGGMSVGWRF